MSKSKKKKSSAPRAKKKVAGGEIKEVDRDKETREVGGGGKVEGAKVDLRRLPRDARPEPKTGQSAPARKITMEMLNRYERAVLDLLHGGGGKRVARTVGYLADGIDAANARLVARNALRRPVSCGLVERVGRAQYMISELGRQRVNRAP